MGKPCAYPGKALALDSSQRLHGISREGHSRGNLYLVLDKRGQVLVLCQRLAAAVDYLNEHAVSDAEDRLSYASLHEIVGMRGGRVDGWYKRRWRVQPLPIDDVASVARFEEARVDHESAVVIGQPERYTTVMV